MRTRHRLLTLPVLLFAACGHSHPLAGNWEQETGSAKKGVKLTFDDTGSRITVHGAPAEDGTHGHPKASFTFDAVTQVLTVTGKLLGDGKADTWTGKLSGEALELAGGIDTLKFKKGGSSD